MNIFETLWGHLPNGLVFLGAVLSFAIPWMVYKTNRKIHQYGDPPWKTEEDSEID